MNSKKPNVILIITDQQRYDTIAALGFPHAITPNLDRLVHEGVHFESCYITAPSCVPSRASLFTGLYPHSNGVICNLDKWQRSWVERLAGNGYRCVNIGKMHTWPMDAPCGFHQRLIVENKERIRKFTGSEFIDEWDKALATHGLQRPLRMDYRKLPDYKQRLGAFEWPLPDKLHSDYFTGDLATWWIEKYAPTDEPLFLQIGFPGPHPPYDPVGSAIKKYAGRDIPVAEIKADDMAGQPSALENLRRRQVELEADAIAFSMNPEMEERKRQREYYLANVTMIDEKVGEILETLESKGLLDDAIVIFTSDHGDTLGDHGQSQKWTMYEQVLRVPLVVWRPGQDRKGQAVSALVQHFDIGATILDYAGVGIPDHMEAESLRSFIDGDTMPGREFVFAELGPDNVIEQIKFMTMVRSADWKLVHFLGSDEGQLFDLRKDPDEEHNLWRDPSCTERKASLIGEIFRWRLESQIKSRNWMADCR
ncbi:MAG: sulfatase-like hydrolase/transferase [Proteobacteria bacterium]|nr:sulfatase-like hydrolase/transferase [Pseudomonadota bacterium]